MLIVKQLINSIISMQNISGYECYIMVGLLLQLLCGGTCVSFVSLSMSRALLL